jgi:DNA-binding beta-propeller fold protein YncE
MRFSTALALAALPSAIAAQGYKVEKFNIGGEGSFDYVTVDPATQRVFIPRGTHVMVIDGKTGKVLDDIKDTPGVRGVAFATKANMGYTTNGRDSTSTAFDMTTLDVHTKVKAGSAGLDGIMYDDFTDRILTIHHSKPGTFVVINPNSMSVVGKFQTSGDAPEGGVSDGKGKIFINIEDKNAIDVVDTKTWKVIASYPTCDGPTGIAMDRTTNRIFSGCSKTSFVIDATTGQKVAEVANGDRVDAMGWDQSQKLMYIPGGDGTVTVVHEDSPDKFTTIETVKTMAGARTIAVDPIHHTAYLFTLERGPSTPSATPGGRPTPGPILGAWMISVHK